MKYLHLINNDMSLSLSDVKNDDQAFSTRIKLNVSEYNIMMYMLTNLNVCISREMLIKKGWPARTINNSSLNVSIMKLREKMLIPEDTLILKTIPGSGYTLCSMCELDILLHESLNQGNDPSSLEHRKKDSITARSIFFTRYIQFGTINDLLKVSSLVLITSFVSLLYWEVIIRFPASNACLNESSYDNYKLYEENCKSVLPKKTSFVDTVLNSLSGV